MTAEEIIARLEGDYIARLRWLVLKEFGVLPGSKRAGELSDRELIRCGAQMVLDKRAAREAGTACGADESGINLAFDNRRFFELKGEEM